MTYYEKKEETILLQDDKDNLVHEAAEENLDVLKKNKFIYYCKLFYYPYSTVLYNNIEIVNINLVNIANVFRNSQCTTNSEVHPKCC